MKIEIIDYELMDKTPLVAKYDVKIIHSEEKWEIFRNVCYFIKDAKEWVAGPKTKRGDKWVDIYERTPKWPFSEVLKAISNHYSSLA